jgi:hypothetical protein
MRAGRQDAGFPECQSAGTQYVSSRSIAFDGRNQDQQAVGNRTAVIPARDARTSIDQPETPVTRRQVRPPVVRPDIRFERQDFAFVHAACASTAAWRRCLFLRVPWRNRWTDVSRVPGANTPAHDTPPHTTSALLSHRLHTAGRSLALRRPRFGRRAQHTRITCSEHARRAHSSTRHEALTRVACFPPPTRCNATLTLLFVNSLQQCLQRLTPTRRSARLPTRVNGLWQS